MYLDCATLCKKSGIPLVWARSIADHAGAGSRGTRFGTRRQP
ncbi:MAG: hypothetical protein U1F77_18275 [Kiritimatiellia bacterium]